MIKGEFLIVYTYKGHTDSVVIETDEFSIHKVFKKKKIHGVIDDIYYPGDWHYDEDLIPIPGEGNESSRKDS